MRSHRLLAILFVAAASATASQVSGMPARPTSEPSEDSAHLPIRPSPDGIALENPRLGRFDCGPASRSAKAEDEFFRRCSFAGIAPPVTMDVEISLGENLNRVKLIMAHEEFEVTLRSLGPREDHQPEAYELNLRLNDDAQRFYAIVVHTAPEVSDLPAVRIEPREKLDELVGHLARSGKRLDAYSRLLDLLKHSSDRHPDNVFLQRALQIALGEPVASVELWIQLRECYNTEGGCCVCYTCTYGDLCLIGECCGNPYWCSGCTSGETGSGSFP